MSAPDAQSRHAWHLVATEGDGSGGARERAVIVVFDAKCLLCSSWVRFLLRHDTRGVVRFASMQGDVGSSLLAQAGLRVDGLQTLLVVDGKKSWQHTAGILRVLHELGWPWRLAWVCWLVPAPMRDSLYRWAARNRYRLFGRADTCLVPPSNHGARFLD